MKQILTVFWLAAAPALFGAGTNSAAPANPPLRVAAGREFTVRLEANRTTGYGWQLASTPNAALVALVRSEYLSPNGGRLGAAGVEAWTFKALAPGRVEIAMKYVRPWETNAPPARTTNVVVVITAREPK